MPLHAPGNHANVSQASSIIFLHALSNKECTISCTTQKMSPICSSGNLLSLLNRNLNRNRVPKPAVVPPLCGHNTSCVHAIVVMAHRSMIRVRVTLASLETGAQPACPLQPSHVTQRKRKVGCSHVQCVHAFPHLDFLRFSKLQ